MTMLYRNLDISTRAQLRRQKERERNRKKTLCGKFRRILRGILGAAG